MLRSYADATLFGETYGAGPVRVVWLHGWARRAEDFTMAAAALAEAGVDSVALDLPGFGASPPPLIAGGARHYAELVVATLREMAEEPLVLVGHSFGGRVATVLSSRHPDLVRALVLSGVPLVRQGTSAKPPGLYRVVRSLHARGLLSDARLEAARQKYGSSDYRRARGLMREVLVANVNESYEDELETLRAPVDFVWGELDREVPLSVAQEAKTLVPGESELHVLANVGHLVPLEAPEALVASVLRALGS